MPISSVALLAMSLLALAAPATGHAKGFSGVVLVGLDGRSTEIGGNDRELDQWIDWSAEPRAAAGGYLRLFFVVPGDFPANPARYYPQADCVALDWPSYEVTCHPLQSAVSSLFRRSRHLPRFLARPTVPARITYLGKFSGQLRTAAALAGPVELALDRKGNSQSLPPSCYEFRAVWAGPAATRRPRQFRLCRGGVYANGVLHPLPRGVWAWFDLNV